MVQKSPRNSRRVDGASSVSVPKQHDVYVHEVEVEPPMNAPDVTGSKSRGEPS
jgi:hypothetical protein